MKKLICLLVAVVLLFGTALAEMEYTCPLCGWTGMAVKFCGGCGEPVSGQWNCSSCGQINFNTKFCGECGQIRPVFDRLWTCVCGNVNDDTKFCGNCGEKRPVVTETASFEIGALVTFGEYPQGSDALLSTPIVWTVLDMDGRRALLVSYYELDNLPYNVTHTNVTWETCTLRAWLNDVFLSKAFTAEEQTGILLTTVDNSRSQGNGSWNTNGGSNTQDKIFLLSYAEARRYFKDDQARKCIPTEFVVRNGGYQYRGIDVRDQSDGVGCGWWWLRSPGCYQDGAALVLTNGACDYYGCEIERGVRPAMWIDLDSGVF